jgi:hypothetical protein
MRVMRSKLSLGAVKMNSYVKFQMMKISEKDHAHIHPGVALLIRLGNRPDYQLQRTIPGIGRSMR